MRKLCFSWMLSAIVLSFSIATFGQSTTGALQGTIKDPKGAVVPGVSVTIKGVTVGFNRTVQADNDGFYTFSSVPHGAYTLTTSAVGGFAETTSQINVLIEKTSTIDITLGITGSVNVVEVQSDPMGVSIDTGDSKVQTTITAALIEKLPAGASFTSLLKVSPGTRQEPLSGGFQVDGASGSENTFIIDGQPMENFRTGVLNGVNNIPTSLVSEIQIKTGGFEAEHGGASGGVISVATKSGSDSLRGEMGIGFDTDKLNPGPRFAPTRFVGSNASQAAVVANPDTVYAIRQPKDSSLNTYPNFTLGGPVVKRHVWFFGTWAPQIFETNRRSNFYDALTNANFSTGKLVLTPRATQLDPIDYRTKTTFNYGYGRMDVALFNNLRGTVSFLWNPSVTKGNIPFAAITTSNPVATAYGGQTYASGEYEKLRGGRTNANTFNTSATWTPTSKLVVNGRYGRVFLNEKGTPYALNSGQNFICSGSATAYTSIVTGCPGGRGYQTFSTNSITDFDISVRNEYNFDASYFVASWGGRHEFKGGYTWGSTTNTVQAGNADKGSVTLYYGQDYAQAGTGVSLPCNLGSASCLGVGVYVRSGAFGTGKNVYQAVFFQDKWQATSRLTMNIGVRAEKENLPAFNVGDTLAGSEIPPIIQGWGRKIAPHLGVAYDLTGDGKSKLYASYGWFYDRLKFELPRGLFGGNFFRRDYFPITAAHPNYDYYTKAIILGSFTDPRGGGNPSTAGGISQLQRDFRIPSNLTPAQFTALGLPVTGVDPDLKSFRQDEITVGFERELSSKYLFSTRYTRKNVAHALEDHAILGLGESENYPIGNPGSGYDLKLDQAAGIAKSAKPQRLYNGVEFTFTKRLSRNYYYSANYTWSRLYGNYSGLASSDENGRLSPAVNRFFDYPINGFTAMGEKDNGLLATDRTHTFKAYGGYTWDWWGSKTNATEFSFFQQVLQGTPQTTFVTVVATSIPLFKRGDLGRTPTFWQTDLAMSHSYKFGRDTRYRIAFDVNVLNALNNNSVTSLNTTRYRVSNSIAGSDIDPTYVAATQTLAGVMNKILTGQIGPQLAQLEAGTLRSIQGNCTLVPQPVTCGLTNPKNALYGSASGYQATRNVRFGFRFIF